MTTINAPSKNRVRNAGLAGASRRTAGAVARRGVDALADVCRGLFGGPAGQWSPTTDEHLDETVELVISPVAASPLASAG